MQKTIAQQLANGYVLDLDGIWRGGGNGRVTIGGNVNQENMKASLELVRLISLAKRERTSIEDLWPQILEATMFVGAYVTLGVAEPYGYKCDESMQSEAYVRNHIMRAAEIANIQQPVA